MVRLPCVAGQFYEDEPARLLKQVTACLPSVPPKNTKRPAKAILVPHAGLMYSGGVAGEIYATLQWTSTVILLGPNHTGEGKPMSLSKAVSWRTPLGDVEIDRDLAQSLLRHAPELEEDEAAHRFEHSLEVQLPFIQLLSKKTKIVPIALGFSTPLAYKVFGTHLAEAIVASHRKVVVIASSDMTHYEPHERVKEKDRYAIEAILSVNPDELTRRVKEREISMCGYAPAMAMLSYAQERGATQGELLRYQTSGDASGDYASVVGYASILIP